jgi:hypothetical protein
MCCGYRPMSLKARMGTRRWTVKAGEKQCMNENTANGHGQDAMRRYRADAQSGRRRSWLNDTIGRQSRKRKRCGSMRSQIARFWSCDSALATTSRKCIASQSQGRHGVLYGRVKSHRIKATRAVSRPIAALDTATMYKPNRKALRQLRERAYRHWRPCQL